MYGDDLSRSVARRSVAVTLKRRGSRRGSRSAQVGHDNARLLVALSKRLSGNRCAGGEPRRLLATNGLEMCQDFL